MEVRIKETGKVAELTIIDPKTGLDWAGDMTAADENITTNEEWGLLECDQETYKWWAELIARYQAADDRYHEIRESVGDEEELLKHIDLYIGVDIENYPEALTQALDEWENIDKE